MSKNTNHYNWQNWVSQTNIKNKKKKVLNEMYQHWVDAIMPDIIKASKQKNTNFRYFFGNEGNRIVIPFSSAKTTQLANLLKLCEQLVWRRYNEEKGRYIEKIKQTYKIITTHLPEDLSKVPEVLTVQNPVWGLELVVPTIRESNFTVQQKTVKQKVAIAGGGTTEQDVTIYEPILVINAYVPFSVKTPTDVVDTIYDETGKKGRPKTEKLTVGQILQSSNEKELFDWWQQNQASFSQDQESISQAMELKGEIDSFSVEKTKELMNSSLTNNSDLSIIISRSPIDVLRMSDFSSMRSCHSQPEQYGGGSYFYCALAESRNQGAIAYLVNTEDLKKVNLNDVEIFADPQRNIKGIVPISRNRLRRIVDRNTSVDLMAVESRTYGAKKIGFVDSINKWVSQKFSKLIMNDPSSTAEEGRYYIPDGDGLALVGGSYTDSGLRGLADNLTSNFRNAADILLEQGEEESNITYLKDTLIEEFDSEVSHNEINYEGDEDESEIEDPCESEPVQEAEEQYNQRASYSTLSLETDCEGRVLNNVRSLIKIDVEISNVGNSKEIKIDTDKVKEINRYENVRRELEDKIGLVFKELVKGNYAFNACEIEATMNLTSYSTGTTIHCAIQLFSDHMTLEEAKMYATGVRRGLESNISYRDEIELPIMNLLQEVGVIKPNVNETEEMQNVIQKFAEHLPETGNHFAWDESSSTEDRGEIEDSFILVADPKRVSFRRNYPIVGKIPTPTKEVSGTKVVDRKMLNQIIEKIQTSYQLGDLIRQEIVKKYGSKDYPPIEQQELFKNLAYQPTRDYVADYVPTVSEIRTTFMIISEDLDLIGDALGAELAAEDFINVRLYFSVPINGLYDTEQQILNTLSFIEKAGSQKEYEEIIKICSEVFRKAFNSVRFPKASSDWMKKHNEEEQEIIASTEKAARTPNTSTIRAPSSSINLPLQGSLFSGIPLGKDEYLPENKTKKLVINERFKRLLRNIKK